MRDTAIVDAVRRHAVPVDIWQATRCRASGRRPRSSLEATRVIDLRGRGVHRTRRNGVA
jgi:hypothetical protein